MIRSYLPALVFLGIGALLGVIFTGINAILQRELAVMAASAGVVALLCARAAELL